MLLNTDKTEYTFFGPHYPKVYEKGELDLTELHLALPRLLFDFKIDDIYSGNSSPELINKKGYFVLQELHEITPKYYLEEHIISDDGTIILSNDTVKYLGMYIDSKLNFKYHTSIITCKISRMIGTFWKCVGLDIKTKKIVA